MPQTPRQPDIRNDLVEPGEHVRHGKEVARLIPATPKIDRTAAHAAVQRIRARAEQKQLGPFDWPEWRAFRDEGRP